jgi:hypothetical protein
VRKAAALAKKWAAKWVLQLAQARDCTKAVEKADKWAACWADITASEWAVQILQDISSVLERDPLKEST